MATLFEKFPPLKFKEKKVVWDTRQALSSESELIIFDSLTSEKIKEELKARASKNSHSILEEHPEGVDVFLAKLAIEQWGEATQKLKVFSVTGTNGKSTSVALLRHLLTRAGLSCAEIGTLGVSVWRAHSNQAESFVETGYTTPLAHQLHYLFYCLVAQGVESVAMETSSHAIELGRIAGLKFAGAIFTNLTQDHLDFHKTMEAYKEAKLKLFRDILPQNPEAISVINTSHEVGREYFKILKSKKIKAVEFSSPQNYQVVESNARGLKIRFSDGVLLESSLVGDFNAENLVGAVELLHQCLKINRQTLCGFLKNYHGVSGRLERVSPLGADYSVFVDYAHTPDALEKVLKSLRGLCVSPQKLICVFGCGGDRDVAKRPLMGALAAQIADQVIVTSDNPRTEDPQTILNQIVAGVDSEFLGKVEVKEDRRQAIEKALGAAQKEDVVLIAGKGHEQYQIIGTEKRPFSDQKVVREFLKL